MLGQDRVELDRVVAQPAPPAEVVRLARSDQRPERGPVAEDPQVAELVDDGRLERLGGPGSAAS